MLLVLSGKTIPLDRGIGPLIVEGDWQMQHPDRQLEVPDSGQRGICSVEQLEQLRKRQLQAVILDHAGANTRACLYQALSL